MPALQNTQIFHEHMHRYLFAAQCVRGLDVLDIACGEGYGSALLAARAARVVGVDVSPEAVAHAERKYSLKNLRFQTGDCRSIPIESASVDVVVSFETIEHLEEHEVFMREIRRVLRPGGLLIISSPDREKYESRGVKNNPFHNKELSHSEFAALMRQHFRHVVLLEQKLVAGSSLELSSSNAYADTVTRGYFRGGLEGGEFVPGTLGGLYAVAVCADAELPVLPLGLFENSDVVAQIWDSFETLPALRVSYLEAQRRLEVLETKANDKIQSGDLGTVQAEQLRLQIVQLEGEVERRGRWGLDLHAEIETLRGLERKQADELEASRRDLRTLTLQKDDELRALKMELVELGEQFERRAKEATTSQEMHLRAETMAHAEKLALVAAHEADRLELRRRLNEMELNYARQREAAEANEVAAVLARGENERKHATILDLAKRLSAAEIKAERELMFEHEEKARLAGELQQLGGRLADQRRRYEDQLAAAQDQFAASLKENQQLMARLNSVDSEVTWNRAQLERWQQSDHNLRQMQTSWSWRVTAPLRKIHQWLGDPLYRRRR